MDLSFIDKPCFSFSEILKLTRLGRGAVEGYIKRGIVELSVKGRGKGFHNRYTGRDLMKIAAISFMSEVGVSPDYVRMVVASEFVVRLNPDTGEALETTRGALDALIDTLVRDGFTEAFRNSSGFIFRPAHIVDWSLHPLSLGGLTRLNDFSDLAKSQRKDSAVSYIVFDAPLFVWTAAQILGNYLESRLGGEKV